MEYYYLFDNYDIELIDINLIEKNIRDNDNITKFLLSVYTNKNTKNIIFVFDIKLFDDELETLDTIIHNYKSLLDDQNRITEYKNIQLNIFEYKLPDNNIEIKLSFHNILSKNLFGKPSFQQIITLPIITNCISNFVSSLKKKSINFTIINESTEFKYIINAPNIVGSSIIHASSSALFNMVLFINSNTYKIYRLT